MQAASIYDGWGCEVVTLRALIKSVFDDVLIANRILLLDNKHTVPAVPDSHFISPLIDFRNPDCLTEDDAVSRYHAKLEGLIWDKFKGYGNADQSGESTIVQLPVYYDIWLQIVVGWDKPSTLIKEYLENE